MISMQTFETVALLPIKANSTRVKGKNFRDFSGKPLFRWVLDSLLEVDEIDKVIINTDARHLLAQHGLVDTKRVLIRDRSSAICGDNVSMNLVIQDDVRNISSDLYVMTHTTNPLLTPATIQRAIKYFRDRRIVSGIDSLFSVNKVQARFYRADSSPVNHDPSNLIPTQNLEPWFEENSNLYVFTADSFARTNARIGINPVLFETSPFESVDIDTPDDWEFALLAAAYLKSQ